MLQKDQKKLWFLQKKTNFNKTIRQIHEILFLSRLIQSSLEFPAETSLPKFQQFLIRSKSDNFSIRVLKQLQTFFTKDFIKTIIRTRKKQFFPIDSFFCPFSGSFWLRIRKHLKKQSFS